MNKNIKVLNNEYLTRGDFVVASIQSISVIEKFAISYFRLWYSGPVLRKEIERNLTISLGYLKGYKSSKIIHDFCFLVFCERSGPFSIQPINSEFISADENCLSKLILYTSLGNEKEAIHTANMICSKSLSSNLILLAKDVNSVLMDLRLGIYQK